MKTALVLEGGALRTIYSSGVCDAFLDGGLPLPPSRRARGPVPHLPPARKPLYP
jgi:hypothetical protein